MLSASARWPPLFPRTSSARMPSWVRCRSISTSSTSSFFFYALWAAAATDCRRLKKGPDARRRPTAAREAYSLYVERAAEGANFFSSLLAAGHGPHDEKRLGPVRDRVGQRGIRRFVGQILLAGEEPHERPALVRDVVAQ